MSKFHTRVYNELYMNKNSQCSPMIGDVLPIKRKTKVTWSKNDNTIVYFNPKRTKLFYSPKDDEEIELEFESDSDTGDFYSDVVCNKSIGCLIS